MEGEHQEVPDITFSSPSLGSLGTKTTTNIYFFVFFYLLYISQLSSDHCVSFRGGHKSVSEPFACPRSDFFPSNIFFFRFVFLSLSVVFSRLHNKWSAAIVEGCLSVWVFINRELYDVFPESSSQTAIHEVLYIVVKEEGNLPSQLERIVLGVVWNCPKCGRCVTEEGASQLQRNDTPVSSWEDATLRDKTRQNRALHRVESKCIPSTSLPFPHPKRWRTQHFRIKPLLLN